MEILNLNINDNLTDWGIMVTPQAKTIVLKDTPKKYDVYKIPIDILVYNPSNGRMFMEAKRFENQENITLEALKEQDPKRYNDEVENLIWSTNEERNLATKRDMQKYGQLEPGVVLDDGTVIDGNRRFTCLRRLHHEFPDDDRFSYFLAALIKVDGVEITHALLKEYELKVQFGVDEKVGYNVINKNMSIYWLIEKNNDGSFDYTKVAELLGNNTTAGDVSKICKTCKLVDEFLEYINQPGEYQIAEDLKIYWPLEPLSTYFMGPGKDLSPLEINQRKHLFFDYLLTLDVALITQNLRDGLIKKIFKQSQVTDKILNAHKDLIGDKIHEIIDNSDNSEEFMDEIKSLKNSQEAIDDKEFYEQELNKIRDNEQIDVPLKDCKHALNSLSNVNVKPLIDASTPVASSILCEIHDVLEKIKTKASEINNEIENSNE